MKILGAARIVRCALTAACLLVATGCVPRHVQIVVPARDAPISERVAAYQTYRPKSTITVIGNGEKSETLRLANDEYVSYVEDLLPGVEASSHTAAHVQRAHAYAVPSDVLSVTSAASTAGFVVSVFAYGFTSEATYTKPLPLTLLAVSLASLLVNSFVFGPVVSSERAKAFESYDADLLQRLHMQRQAHVEDLDNP